jgi:hypothetical protein
MKLSLQARLVRRQILVITHNLYSVVNTDAEQIIVAHCTKRTDGCRSALNVRPVEPRRTLSACRAAPHIQWGAQLKWRMRPKCLI